jgi:hypothetical protein
VVSGQWSVTIQQTIFEVKRRFFGVRRLAAALRLGQSVKFISDLKAAASRRTPEKRRFTSKMVC